jgi:DNA polymerase-1
VLAVGDALGMKTPSSKPRLFLVDAMGYIFRAYFAPMERLRNPRGIPTKVPYLFANMIQRLLRDWKPDYLGVVFDVAAPTFRDEIFKAYKAQRPPMPDDLALQLPFVRQYCEAMRLPMLEFAGFEADDVIGTLARRAAAQDIEIIIVTSDKDLLQLVGGNVRALNPAKDDVVLDEKAVEEFMGVPPAKVPDLIALMGDSIDNIPGARDPADKPAPGERRKAGIGEVGARQLIQQFGSAEGSLAHAAEVSRASYREALQKCGEFVRLSKTLATIHTDAPVPLELEKLTLQPPDAEALRALYNELGFTSLLRDLVPSPSAASAKTDYASLKSPQELNVYLASLPTDEPVAVWIEPHASDEDPGFGSSAARIEISPSPGIARYADADNSGLMLAELRDWLASRSHLKSVHDPKLLALMAAAEDSEIPAPVENVRHSAMHYSFLLMPTTANHSLPNMALRHLGATPTGALGEEADFLGRLSAHLQSEVAEQGVHEMYEKIDLPLAPVLARMEHHGVLVDRKALEDISSEAETEIRALETSIFDLAGGPFNPNSPQQLAEILFDRLKLPGPRRRGGKSRSTSIDVLEELASSHELPRRVIEYRELSKLKSTYADALPKLIDLRTGRLHTRLSQTGAATGRLSSSNPNLQNIPVRTKLGRKIRAAFAAAPGNFLLSADYSQIELRLLAHFSRDPVLLDAFRRGEDIHARTASEVFGVPPLLQTPENRRAAKIINFGIVYGLSPFGLAQQLNISQKEAAQFINDYFARLSAVKAYLDRQVADVRRSGETRTLFGRLRPIPEINSPQPALRNFAERTAMNTPLQGTAADIIKLAMIELDRRLTSEGFRSRMILQVHDELLFEGPRDEMKRLGELVKPVMEQSYGWRGPLLVPLIVEMKAGPNWRDMESTF